MIVFVAHTVTSDDRFTSTIHTESLRPPQIHAHYKSITSNSKTLGKTITTEQI